MARCVRFRVIDGIAVVSLDAPPVNALSAAVRAGLWEVFGRIAAQDNIAAVVLRAEGAIFSAGADIREFGETANAPALRQLFDRIEACPKPVVAALNGKVLGGGAEMALAAHYRVAEPLAQIGFPEISLGLLAGAGGTQRLPRLVGSETALAMMITGRSIEAPVALRCGLIDGIVQNDLATGALTFVRSLLEQGKGPRRSAQMRHRMADGRAYQSHVSKARHDLANNALFAPHLIVDCVEAAALLPFEAGVDFEADAFDRCYKHPQSVALRHAFLAERRTSKDMLAREGGQFKPTDPAGREVVLRLRRAMRAGAQHLVASDQADEQQIDQAQVSYGFRKGSFGGRDGGRADDLIMRKMIGALVAEGAALIEEGVLKRPSDVDAMCIHGLGYPRREGGPMRAAQTIGLLRLRHDMSEWADENILWTPPDLLDEAIKEAPGFDRFNA